MNNYKELIGDIGDCLIAQPSEALCKRILREAADAIERLVKERDAAIADLRKIAGCDFCILENASPYSCLKKECVHGENGNSAWEWRGVQEEELG